MRAPTPREFLNAWMPGIQVTLRADAERIVAVNKSINHQPRSLPMTATKAEAAAPAVGRKKVRKLTLKIDDADKVLTQFPTCELVITKRTVDKHKLRPIVKALHDAGAKLPDGVRAWYSEDGEPADDAGERIENS